MQNGTWKIYYEIQARRKQYQFSSITFEIRKFIQCLDLTSFNLSKEIFDIKTDMKTIENILKTKYNIPEEITFNFFQLNSNQMKQNIKSKIYFLIIQ